ncbi:hypothetical protein AJ87_44560 [Rhizobium yanglingense]|nr:hypothetical protein AJ87_44560 [Rhizobium yanglingense]
MHLVEIGHGTVAFGELADAMDRRDVAVHGIEAFEDDELRPLEGDGLQQFLKVSHVVVAEDLPFHSGLANPLDHGIVVERIGQDQTVGYELGDGGDARLVGYIPRREDQSRILAMQIREFGFQFDKRMVCAGNVAGTARTCPVASRSVNHGFDHLGMLSHTEIIVGAPDDDLPRSRWGAPGGEGKTSRDPLQIGKDAVSLLCMEA